MTNCLNTRRKFLSATGAVLAGGAGSLIVPAHANDLAPTKSMRGGSNNYRANARAVRSVGQEMARHLPVSEFKFGRIQPKAMNAMNVAMAPHSATRTGCLNLRCHKSFLHLVRRMAILPTTVVTTKRFFCVRLCPALRTLL